MTKTGGISGWLIAAAVMSLILGAMWVFVIGTRELIVYVVDEGVAVVYDDGVLEYGKGLVAFGGFVGMAFFSHYIVRSPVGYPPGSVRTGPGGRRWGIAGRTGVLIRENG